jgi:hypothetical protein
MFLLGIISILVGLWLAIFNRRISARLSGHSVRHYSEEFMYSVTRQNIAISGGAFIFGGLLLLYLA